MSKKHLSILIVIVLIIIAFIIGRLSNTNKSRDELIKNDSTQAVPITLGFIGPLTGEVQSIGENAKAAVEIAVEEINSQGGINDKQLNIIYEDGRCNGKDATSAANKLISIDKVPVILGGACSSETSAFAKTSEEAQIVTFSYCSSAPDISHAGDYIFRNYPSDTHQGKFAAQYIYNDLNKTKVALLYENADWGAGIGKVFEEEYKKLGGTIVSSDGFQSSSRDLRTQLSKIKKSDAEILYFLARTEASIVGINQANELGLNIPIFGGDVWDDTDIWEATQYKNVMFSKVYAPLSNHFKNKMKQKLGHDSITICSPQAYDATYILAKIIAEVGTDSTNIKQALYNLQPYQGVSNDSISFDSNGDVKDANFEVMTVKNKSILPFNK